MLDIKLIRENPEKVKKAIDTKYFKEKRSKYIDQILKLDKEKREILTKQEALQAEINKLSKKKPSADEIKKLKAEKEKIKKFNADLQKIDPEFKKLMSLIPNLPADDVPVGKDEADNVVLRKVGKPTKFSFKPKDHIEIGKALDLIDIERAVKISGARFYYLKNEAVLLEFALINYAMDLLVKEGFCPIIPPVLAKEEIFEQMGYLPDSDLEMYKTTIDGLRIAGTSEQTIGPMHKNEILDKNNLPLRYAGFSSCFRREAGSYGKDTKGILRAHQFDKIEMFSYTKPENSKKEHDFLLSLEEKIMQGLELPYQVINICTGDLGEPASKKYDIETWMPGQERYRETHSTSNCTDFQSRSLNIKYSDGNNKDLVHTLNGTAIAVGRTLIAILENYQQKDGSVAVPKVLQKYMGIKIIKR